MLLAAAIEVHEAEIVRDDQRIREALRWFWRAVFADAQLNFGLDIANQACEYLTDLAGGKSEDCPILSSRHYANELREALFIGKPMLLIPKKRPRPAPMAIESRLNRMAIGLPAVPELPKSEQPTEEVVDAMLAALRSEDARRWLLLGLPNLTQRLRAINDRTAVANNRGWGATESITYVAVQKAAPETVTLLPSGKLTIGDETITLTDRQRNVLQALVEKRSAQKSELISASGHDEAPKILRGLVNSYPVLARFITTPGRKGAGGYRTTIAAAASMQPLSAPQSSTI